MRPVALPAVAAPVPKALKKPPASPDGHWHLIEFSSNGTPETSLHGFARHAVIKDELLTWFRDGQQSPHASEKFAIIDPARPHVRRWGYNPGVYEMDGDTLRACCRYGGGEELTECKPGKGIHYYVFERVKEEK